MKEVKEKSMSKDVEDVMSIADELSVNVEKAKSFSVKKVIEEESKNVASLRDLMEKEQVDDEDDEDFSEEEGEDDDVIIEDVEELKKSVKRVGESLPDSGKEAKKNSSVCSTKKPFLFTFTKGKVFRLCQRLCGHLGKSGCVVEDACEFGIHRPI